MGKGMITIFTGEGRGKSMAAIGKAVLAASEGKSVMIIQFMKGRGFQESEFAKRLEPEIKFFRFERLEESYEDLTEEQKREECMNIKNGLNFARKVLSTGECDLLILDEVLGLVDREILSPQELKELLDIREETDIVLTGIMMKDEICFQADEVSKIETVKSAAAQHAVFEEVR